MNKSPLRVAIIGCGWAGLRHAQAFVQCRAEVGWAIDLNPDRASICGAPGKTRVAADYHVVLSDPDVDAIDICLPHNLHAKVAVEAAEAGKHILCEKPLADTLEAADLMINAAERAGVVLMVAENVRFDPLFHKIRELLDKGVIGTPALLQRSRECYLTRSFTEDRPWFLDAKAAAGGIMMSGGVHDFEMARMLLGDIESIYALRAPQRFMEMQGDDTSIALVRFQNGAVGTFVESFVMKSLITAAGPEVHTLRIDGELGSLEVQDRKTIRLFSEQGTPFLGESLVQHDIIVPQEDTFVLEVRHFIHCVHTGQTPLTSGCSQRRPLACVLAAYQSMASGQPIKVLQK